ncbi:MAG: hypothetical protein HC898_10030, partial [Phycisphaerales bacterium]|nr:hypothetical protein [Phycisphaerales bacterium]
MLKEKSASASGSGATPQTESGNGKSVPPAIIRITLMGLAPSDAEIADFFGGMVELPVFEMSSCFTAGPRISDRCWPGNDRIVNWKLRWIVELSP